MKTNKKFSFNISISSKSRLMIFCFISSFLLSLAGCGSNDDSSDDDGRTAPTPTASVSINLSLPGQSESFSASYSKGIKAAGGISDISKVTVWIHKEGTLVTAVQSTAGWTSGSEDIRIASLPTGTALDFIVKAFNSDNAALFSGETQAALTAGDNQVDITMIQVDNETVLNPPQIVRMERPETILPGGTSQFKFYFEGEADQEFTYQLSVGEGSFSDWTNIATLDDEGKYLLTTNYIAPIGIISAPAAILTLSSGNKSVTLRFTITLEETSDETGDGNSELNIFVPPVIKSASVTFNDGSSDLSLSAESDPASGINYTWGVTQQSAPLSLKESVSNTASFSGYDFQTPANISITVEMGGVNTSMSFTLAANSFPVVSGYSWQTVGPAAFSDGRADKLSLVTDSSGDPLIAYIDETKGYKTTVGRYNNGSWEYLGQAGFSDWAAEFLDLAVDASGNAWLAYDNISGENKATVSRFNSQSGSWETVGAANFSTAGAGNLNLIIDASGDPWLAYQDAYGPAVMKFNGQSGSWEDASPDGWSASAATLTVDASGDPWLAYVDMDNSSKATVKRFRDGSWENVGQAGFSAEAVSENYLSLTLNAAGTSWLAYAHDIYDNAKLAVMKFNGDSWESVPNAGLSSGFITNMTLASDNNGALYLAYKHADNFDTLMKLEDQGNSWKAAGYLGALPSYIFHVDLAVNVSGTPYLAYIDDAYKIIVMKFDRL